LPAEFLAEVLKVFVQPAQGHFSRLGQTRSQLEAGYPHPHTCEFQAFGDPPLGTDSFPVLPCLARFPRDGHFGDKLFLFPAARHRVHGWVSFV
jgi:hypothetical protein